MEIDVCRRDRLNYMGNQSSVQDVLSRTNNETYVLHDVIDKRRSKAIHTQNQMLELKTRNEIEKSNYMQ